MIKYKRSKFSQLPGDIPKDYKIRMLESKQPFLVWPWQRMGVRAIQTFRNEFYKRANRRLRRQSFSCEDE
jgi:hypothetical protein